MQTGGGVQQGFCMRKRLGMLGRVECGLAEEAVVFRINEIGSFDLAFRQFRELLWGVGCGGVGGEYWAKKWVRLCLFRIFGDSLPVSCGHMR
jgi:hypothetical protein